MKRLLCLLLALALLTPGTALAAPGPEGGVAVQTSGGLTTSLTVYAPEGQYIFDARWSGSALYILTAGGDGAGGGAIYAADMTAGTLTPVLTRAEEDIQDFLPLADGSVWALCGPGGIAMAEGTALLHTDASGQTLASCDLSGVQAQAAGMAAGPDGGLYLLLSGADSVVTAVDAGGNILTHIPLPDGIYTSLVSLPEGQAAAGYFLTDRSMTLLEAGVVVLDGEAARKLPLPEDAALGEQPEVLCGDRDTLWLQNGRKVLSYDRAAGTVEERFHWLDMGVSAPMTVFLREDGSLWAVESPEGGYDCVRVFALPMGSGARRTLTLASIYLDSDDLVRKAVLSFNRENPYYQVEVKDYFDPSTGDYDGAWQQLSYELIAGDTPDLFDLGSLLGGEQDSLIKQGLLTDLTGYMDAGAIRREDFLPAVWDVASVDGHVYAAAPAFSLSTLTCHPGDIKAGAMDWAAFADMPAQGEDMFLCWDAGEGMRYDRADLLQELLRARFGEFVDEQAGVCDFESQAFLDLLSFVQTVPFVSRDGYDWPNEPCPARFAGDTLFGYQSLASESAYMGPERVFCGWPGADGPVGYLTLEGAVGICAKTDCPEGCLAFLQCLLDMDPGRLHFPARLDRLQAAGEQAMAEEGVTQAQIDAVNALLDWDYARQSRLKTDVLQMAYEAAVAFYSGETDAAQTAADLQSRASIYIAEHC